MLPSSRPDCIIRGSHHPHANEPRFALNQHSHPFAQRRIVVCDQDADPPTCAQGAAIPLF
jgi:hypothetical protein